MSKRPREEETTAESQPAAKHARTEDSAAPAASAPASDAPVTVESDSKAAAPPRDPHEALIEVMRWLPILADCFVAFPGACAQAGSDSRSQGELPHQHCSAGAEELANLRRLQDDRHSDSVLLPSELRFSELKAKLVILFG